MVNHDGQLYTIEGVAAGLIMLLTAFIVVGTTSVYTPGDTHISDMQLEQLGSDALHMMNTPNTSAFSSESDLQNMIKINNLDSQERFKKTFLLFCNTTVGGTNDDLHFSADIYYRNALTNAVNWSHFTESRNPTGGEHAVRVTEWVHLTTWPSRPVDAGSDRARAVLLEVLVWRD